MLITIPYWILAILVAIIWILQILLAIPPETIDYRDNWQRTKEVLIDQANRLFYLLLAFPISWFCNTYYLFEFSLSNIVWIIRIFILIRVIHQAICFVYGLFTGALKLKSTRRLMFSNLLVLIIFTLSLCAI